MAGVLARLSWLGIAREMAPGMPALPTAAVPADPGSFEPEDTPQYLFDTGVRASMGTVAGAVQGTLSSAHSFGGPLYPDSCGWWLDNLLGDLSTTSGGTLGTAQPLAAANSAGDTQITVTASLGAVTAGSVVQVSDGASSEVVTATAGSTGTSVQCAGTPLRFPHTTTATAALQTAATGYTHTFAALNSGTGQPPTHTLTVTTGLTAGTGARCHPGAAVTQIDLAGDPARGWATAKVTGVAWLSQPSTQAVPYPGGYVAPFAGWQAAVTAGAGTAYPGPWQVTLKRQTVIYRSAGNPQNPLVIARGGLEVTGALGYPAPSDETPLTQMLTSGYTGVNIALSSGASSLTLNCAQTQFTRAKLGFAALALGYGTGFQAIDNAGNAGGSGGISPAQVTLVNSIATY